MYKTSGVFPLYFDGMTQAWKTESGTVEYFTGFKHHKAIKGRNRKMASDSRGVKMIILTVKLHIKSNFWMNLTGFICGSWGVNVILLHLGEEIKAHLHLNAFQLFSFLCVLFIFTSFAVETAVTLRGNLRYRRTRP